MKQSTLRHLSVLLLCLGATLASYGVWSLVRGEDFQAKTVVKYDAFPSEIGGAGHFGLTNEMEFIQSNEVLGRVIQRLSLNQEANGGAASIGDSKTCAELRRRIDVSNVRNTMLMKVSVRDHSPEQAAKIANTIAEVYRDNRLERLRKQSEARVRALEEQWNKLKAETDKAFALVIRLRDELKVSAAEETGWSKRLQITTNVVVDKRIGELRPFDEAMRDLEKVIQFKKEFETRISMEKINQSLPRHGVVTIMDRALPPETPLFPTHKQSVILLLSGLLLIAVSGVLLLKPKASQVLPGQAEIS